MTGGGQVDGSRCLRPLPWLHAVRNSYRSFPAVTRTEALARLHHEPRPTEVPQ